MAAAFLEKSEFLPAGLTDASTPGLDRHVGITWSTVNTGHMTVLPKGKGPEDQSRETPSTVELL